MSNPVLKVVGNGIEEPKLRGDVGYDLKASVGCYLFPGRMTAVPVNANVQIPRGYWGLIIARSSVNRDGSLAILPGVIDEGYRGQLFVYAWNHDPQGQLVEKGDRLAQMVLIPSAVFPIERVEELDESERGTRGFGSTGS